MELPCLNKQKYEVKIAQKTQDTEEEPCRRPMKITGISELKAVWENLNKTAQQLK